MKKNIFNFLLLLFFILSSCGTGQDSKVNDLQKKDLHTELGNIKFDQTITKFQLATILGDRSNRFLYSLHGKEDLNNSSPTSGFYFETMKNMRYDEAKMFLKKFSSDYGENSGMISTDNFKESTSKVNGLDSYTITFTAIDQSNKKIYLTQSILSQGENSILFVGCDFDKGIYSDKFINTFKSIEL